jgi:hypothetical protein
MSPAHQCAVFSAFGFLAKARQGSNGMLQPPIDSAYLPPPLSPRRPISPSHAPSHALHPSLHPSGSRTDEPGEGIPGRLLHVWSSAGTAAPLGGHQRGNSHESVSWLDPIDESAGSSASSVHSRSSSMNIRRRHIRAASGDTEAEFDAALDDAIEAAYNDGYEPEQQDTGEAAPEDPEEVVANTLRRVELARERVRESERGSAHLGQRKGKTATTTAAARGRRIQETRRHQRRLLRWQRDR